MSPSTIHKRRFESKFPRRPITPKHVAIAEGLTEYLFGQLDLDMPANLDMPAMECGDPWEGYGAWLDEAAAYDDGLDEPLADWERALLDLPAKHDMHDSAHTRECEDCAYQHALTNWPEPDEFVSPYQQAVTEMDVFPAESWLPLMSYRQAADAMGGAFLVTGPKVDRPESTDQHYIRVYELARACDLPSRAVIALLRLQDQYVADHLSLIARPAARDLLAALDIHDDLDVLIEKTRPLSIPEQFARAIA